jgi:cohesin loading factor subunit SCC2
MPEGIVIQAVYIGIGPFFVEPSGAGSASGGTGSTGKGRDKDNFGAVAMKEMRSTALSLTKTVGCSRFVTVDSPRD